MQTAKTKTLRTSLLVWLISSLILPLQAIYASSPAAKTQGKTADQGNVRTLHFPKDHSIGGLFLVPANFISTRSMDYLKPAGHGKGDSTIVVPSGNLLVLELNRYAFDHPELISEVSGTIDGVKVKFSSMDYKEEGCDKILPYLAHFQDASYVDLDHSDVTDKGMAHLASMSKLKVIHAFSAPISGACLKDLSGIPNIERLDFGFNPIKTDDLCFVSKLPNLRALALARCMLKDEGVKQIGKCRNLVNLAISTNHDLSDNCIPYLLSLKKLESLDIFETSISVRGVKSLAALNLKTLRLPKADYSAEEKIGLKKSLANTRLDFPLPHKIDDFSKVMFAPTTR